MMNVNIDVIVNGRGQILPDRSTVSMLLREMKLYDGEQLPRGLAVAVNEEVVPRDSWRSHELQDGDSILLITATQGG